MDLKKRLSKVITTFKQSKLIRDKPDFDSFTDKEIVEHLIRTIERRHRTDNIKTVEAGIRYWQRIPTKAITNKERNLMLKIEKSYWNGELKELLNELEG